MMRPCFLRLFPHSIIEKAKEWYLDQTPQVMNNWDVLEEKFIARSFPSNRHMKAKTTLFVFSQGSNETLCEAWEHFKSLLRKCLKHGFDDMT